MRGGNIQKTGFTIVELLIVVVVIAILATITIVTYNGIQQRAKESQFVSALNSYSKATRAYYITHNALPSSSTACYDGTACWSGVSTAQSEALRTELQKVMASLPTFPSPDYIALLANGTVGSYSGPYMLFQYPGSQECFTIGGARVLNTTSSGGFRTCRVALEM